MSALFWLTAVLLVVVSLLLSGLVLLQRGSGVGLLFGSGRNSVLGSQAPTVLTRITLALFVLFVLLAVALNLLT